MSVSRFQYPAQTTAYKVKVKHGDDWKLHDTCCLDISVGKNYHEGVKLEATIGWAQHRFKHVAVAVNDTLQRFNAMFTGGMTEAEAAELARQKGDEWILRNKEILDQLPSYEIFRWNDWTGRADFPEKFARAQFLYRHNDEFRQNIDSQIDNIWTRRYGSKAEMQHKKAEFRLMSYMYLMEETAVFAMMAETRNDIHIYPGSFMKIWGNLEDENLPGLSGRKFARIDFSRNKSVHIPAQPQGQALPLAL
ncbi:MAG: tRNA-dependent cyclodipeptide synthase [Pseudomonadota bacterium]|jgi:tRNA-dependent cyclodipeptide synthase|nr:tRNA-dependent cyclodipeptide synthase [Pseudomonadota bacterium]QKK05913.1 MAG: tRNA-dependent cyclodipeptide synthase [Pseudomonadota bacterium]